MNTGTEEAPPVPPHPHRSSFSCDRHPTEQFSGFCPSCLCERLATLELSSRCPASSSSSAAAALKSIFRPKQTLPQQHSHPELRRTQSFSASKNEAFSGVLDPQRHSCDVRGRNTLWSLFNLADDNHRKSSASLIDQKQPQIEEEEDSPGLTNEVETIQIEDAKDSEDEIRAWQDGQREVETKEEEDDEVKTMKEHIHLDSHAKKPSSSSGVDLRELAGNFWSAASVFSKKWQKWRQKQKLKKRQPSRRGGPTLPVEKPISRQYLETQSEIADYGLGRRSCDTEPARFSLDATRISFDAARMSFDDVRPSFDEPRASWDGFLIGGCSNRSFPRLPPICSVVEDSPAAVHVVRSDMQIPVEEDEKVPGGSTQTREYYSDSSRSRKSLDRSNSIRKTAAAVVGEMEEMKAVANAKVTPAAVEHRLSVDSNSNSLRDDCSETFELPYGDNGTGIGTAERKGLKKSRRWKNIWGLIIRRTGGIKDDNEEGRYSRGNGVERSLSESWQELRRERNGEGGGGFNTGMFRSHSSLNWRNSNINDGPFGSVRNTGFETNGRRKRGEVILERNRSARYSPNHVDNGLLQFYLTPLRGSCRRVGRGKNRPNSQSIARSVLRLY